MTSKSFIDTIESRLGDAIEKILSEQDATPALADVDTKGDKAAHHVAEALRKIADKLSNKDKEDEAEAEQA